MICMMHVVFFYIYGVDVGAIHLREGSGACNMTRISRADDYKTKTKKLVGC